MKSIIMTAQDVREFVKLRALIISKPIKSAPAYVAGAQFIAHEAGQWLLAGPEDATEYFTPPVIAGDVVFIREPWAYLTNPTTGEKSEHINFAADALAEPIAYKWASPVSMPASSARHYARVVTVVPVYNANAAAWEITLEEISKGEAEARETGLPYSTADTEEERSDYYTLGADMTPEDHEKMCAAIDADRARLEVIRSRRREIAIKLGGGASDFGEGEALENEETALAREEGEIVSALEDAHVNADNPLPPPEEIRKKAAALKDVQDEARILTALIADPATRGDMEPEEYIEAQIHRHEKADALAEEERVLTVYLDAIRAGESPTDDFSDAPPEIKALLLANAEALKAKAAAEETEEVGSFTLGKCAYCGREWGITLEGAPGGGYPTQRTANAAATRVCDCEEAIKNRAPIVGVALAVTTGACHYCGQMIEVGPHPSQRDADETASQVCSCPDARSERWVEEQIEDACDRVQRLFGSGAEDLGFKPLAENESIKLLERVVELIARRAISAVTIQIRGQCKAKIGLTTKGKIKVARSETHSYDLEAGE